jgi:hypothetical protein
VIGVLAILGGLLTLGLIVVVVRALSGMSSSADEDNDFTGSNANFGKSLMGDNDQFGKGL